MSTWQEQALAAFNAGIPDFGRNDEAVDLSDEVPPNPVQVAFEKEQFVKAGGPEGWDDPTPAADDGLTKTLVANRVGQPFGSAVLLKAARTEERQVGADTWRYRYDASGELISAGVVSTDGGALSKRSEEGTTVDLTKAARPGMVRFERTAIDNEDWILGWNDKGENVRAYPAEEVEA